MGGEAEDQQSPLLRSCSSPEGPLERTDESGSLSGGLQGSSILTFLYVVYMSIKTVVFSNKLNSLIVFGPAAILVQKLTDKSAWVFFLSLVGITPLAKRLGYATEQLAFYTGPTVGGLLNATFGNAIELIISILAMKSGMIRVVQLSLLGSILSNLLLVLGCAFFYGGFVLHKEQLFNKTTAVVNSGLLFMAVMGLLFPTVLHYTHTKVYFGKSELALSRFSTCIMLVTYAAYLFFQLKNQRNLNVPLNERASIALNMPVSFISVILLPLVGNAVDHASAITFAMKDKLDITLGVSIGSSTQMALFVEGTHYFKGLMLPLCYLIVAASFFVHVDVSPGVQLKFHLV
ncbi:vacuolar cation/proton exchanger 5-like isoform X3 [Quercus robur]|uniref:vacuolar cation/proton exchanger 5-like isoform X3 n=1 Tax=Quercus robur TaxID=38942 RepID=UPI0021617D9A|nr:vacuolar cation/proton exchanger 5-like isoform X3 [Quercus robur]